MGRPTVFFFKRLISYTISFFSRNTTIATLNYSLFDSAIILMLVLKLFMDKKKRYVKPKFKCKLYTFVRKTANPNSCNNIKHEEA